MKKQRGEITISDIIGIFLPKLWIIALVAAILGAASGFWVMSKPRTYTSTVTLYVYRSDSNSVNTSDITAAETMMNNYKYLLKSRDFVNRVKLELDNMYPEHSDVSVGQISGTIGFSVQSNTTYFHVSSTSTDKTLATNIATVICEIAPAHITDRIPDTLEVTIFEDPVEATPNSKGTFKAVIIGALAGALVSALAIWIIAMFDVKIRDKKKLEDTFDIPVLAVIPQHIIPETEEKGEKNNVAV